MPLILGGSSGPAAAFSVDNSCRFNDGDSPRLYKTLGTPTNLDKWTFSVWVKRGDLTGNPFIFEAYDDVNNVTRLFFESTDQIAFWNKLGGSYVGQLTTDRLFRDPAAWYHIVAVWDSDNASAGDRMRLYVNGVEETSFALDTNPTSGELCSLASGDVFNVGSNGTPGDYMDGYMAEAVLLDGTAATPTSFGEFDEDSPTIFKPIDVSGLTFGTNGLYLDFEDSANLGNDVSGNGNDLTVANLAAVDQCTDTPMNNFCTLNPLDNYWSGATFSEGNTKVVTGSGVYAPVFSTVGLNAGKWYWEVIPTIAGAGNPSGLLIGVGSSQTTAAAQELGHNANDYGFYGQDGKIRNNDAYASYGAAYAVDDVIGVALDLTNNKLYFAKNNTWENSGDPTSGATGTGAFSITMGVLDRWVASCSYWDASTATYEFNFGNPPSANTSDEADANDYGKFEYAPPSGYLALCTKNLGSDGG
jgi:hypothetical protein